MTSGITTAIIIAAASLILQKTLNNLFYGLFLFFVRPFHIGDKVFITQHGRSVASGRVVAMGPLNIRIKEYSRDICILPNSLLETCVIVNSDYKERVNHIETIKVSYTSDLDRVEEIIRECIMKNENTLNVEENTRIIFKATDGGVLVEYNIRTQDTDSSFDVSSQITKEIVHCLQKDKMASVAI